MRDWSHCDPPCTHRATITAIFGGTPHRQKSQWETDLIVTLLAHIAPLSLLSLEALHTDRSHNERLISLWPSLHTSRHYHCYLWRHSTQTEATMRDWSHCDPLCTHRATITAIFGGTPHRQKSQWETDLIVTLPAHIAPLSLAAIFGGTPHRQKSQWETDLIVTLSAHIAPLSLLSLEALHTDRGHNERLISLWPSLHTSRHYHCYLWRHSTQTEVTMRDWSHCDPPCTHRATITSCYLWRHSTQTEVTMRDWSHCDPLCTHRATITAIFGGTPHRQKSQWETDLIVTLPAHIAPLSLLSLEALHTDRSHNERLISFWPSLHTSRHYHCYLWRHSTQTEATMRDWSHCDPLCTHRATITAIFGGTPHRQKSQWETDLIVTLPAHIAPLSLAAIFGGTPHRQKSQWETDLIVTLSAHIAPLSLLYLEALHTDRSHNERLISLWPSLHTSRHYHCYLWRHATQTEVTMRDWSHCDPPCTHRAIITAIFGGTPHRQKSQWETDLIVTLPAHIAPLSLLSLEALHTDRSHNERLISLWPSLHTSRHYHCYLWRHSTQTEVTMRDWSHCDPPCTHRATITAIFGGTPHRQKPQWETDLILTLPAHIAPLSLLSLEALHTDRSHNERLISFWPSLHTSRHYHCYLWWHSTQTEATMRDWSHCDPPCTHRATITAIFGGTPHRQKPQWETDLIVTLSAHIAPLSLLSLEALHTDRSHNERLISLWPSLHTSRHYHCYLWRHSTQTEATMRDWSHCDPPCTHRATITAIFGGTPHRQKSQWETDLIVTLPAHIAPLSLAAIFGGTPQRQKSQWETDLIVTLPAHIAPLSLLSLEALHTDRSHNERLISLWPSLHTSRHYHCYLWRHSTQTEVTMRDWSHCDPPCTHRATITAIFGGTPHRQKPQWETDLIVTLSAHMAPLSLLSLEALHTDRSHNERLISLWPSLHTSRHYHCYLWRHSTQTEATMRDWSHCDPPCTHRATITAIFGGTPHRQKSQWETDLIVTLPAHIAPLSLAAIFGGTPHRHKSQWETDLIVTLPAHIAPLSLLSLEALHTDRSHNERLISLWPSLHTSRHYHCYLWRHSTQTEVTMRDWSHCDPPCTHRATITAIFGGTPHRQKPQWETDLIVTLSAHMAPLSLLSLEALHTDRSHNERLISLWPSLHTSRHHHCYLWRHSTQTEVTMRDWSHCDPLCTHRATSTAIFGGTPHRQKSQWETDLIVTLSAHIAPLALLSLEALHTDRSHNERLISLWPSLHTSRHYHCYLWRHSTQTEATMRDWSHCDPPCTHRATITAIFGGTPHRQKSQWETDLIVTLPAHIAPLSLAAIFGGTPHRHKSQWETDLIVTLPAHIAPLSLLSLEALHTDRSHNERLISLWPSLHTSRHYHCYLWRHSTQTEVTMRDWSHCDPPCTHRATITAIFGGTPHRQKPQWETDLIVTLSAHMAPLSLLSLEALHTDRSHNERLISLWPSLHTSRHHHCYLWRHSTQTEVTMRDWSHCDPLCTHRATITAIFGGTPHRQKSQWETDLIVTLSAHIAPLALLSLEALHTDRSHNERLISLWPSLHTSRHYHCYRWRHATQTEVTMRDWSHCDPPCTHRAIITAIFGGTPHRQKPSQQETFLQRSLKVVFRLTENKFPSNVFGTFW